MYFLNLVGSRDTTPEDGPTGSRRVSGKGVEGKWGRLLRPSY